MGLCNSKSVKKNHRKEANFQESFDEWTKKVSMSGPRKLTALGNKRINAFQKYGICEISEEEKLTQFQ